MWAFLGHSVVHDRTQWNNLGSQDMTGNSLVTARNSVVKTCTYKEQLICVCVGSDWWNTRQLMGDSVTSSCQGGHVVTSSRRHIDQVTHSVVCSSCVGCVIDAFSHAPYGRDVASTDLLWNTVMNISFVVLLRGSVHSGNGTFIWGTIAQWSGGPQWSPGAKPR